MKTGATQADFDKIWDEIVSRIDPPDVMWVFSDKGWFEIRRKWQRSDALTLRNIFENARRNRLTRRVHHPVS